MTRIRPSLSLRIRPNMSPATTESKREQIIDLASELFFRQGYKATGIKQIIDEAGIAKGTFYSHFKSKEELGLAWLQKRHNHWVQWRENYVAAPDRTPTEQILALFTSLKDWMGKCDFRGCLFLNTLTETPEADSPMRCEIRNHKQGMVDFIRTRIDSIHPQLDDEQRVRMARTIFLLFEASVIECQNFRDYWPLETAIAQVKTMLAPQA